VTAGAAAGPAAVLALADQDFALSLGASLAAALLAAGGWLAAVLVTRHPVLTELARALEAVAQASIVQRCWRWRDRTVAQGARAEQAR
jgi:hypothetical protein